MLIPISESIMHFLDIFANYQKMCQQQCVQQMWRHYTDTRTNSK